MFNPPSRVGNATGPSLFYPSSEINSNINPSLIGLNDQNHVKYRYNAPGGLNPSWCQRNPVKIGTPRDDPDSPAADLEKKALVSPRNVVVSPRNNLTAYPLGFRSPRNCLLSAMNPMNTRIANDLNMDLPAVFHSVSEDPLAAEKQAPGSFQKSQERLPAEEAKSSEERREGNPMLYYREAYHDHELNTDITPSSANFEQDRDIGPVPPPRYNNSKVKQNGSSVLEKKRQELGMVSLEEDLRAKDDVGKSASARDDDATSNSNSYSNGGGGEGVLCLDLQSFSVRK